MKRYNINKVLITVLFALAVLFLPVSIVNAKTLDEIIDYDITVDVLDDATLDMTYIISWKVLDSKSEGPLSWVNIGIPNKHCNSYEPLTDNIKSMETSYSGGSTVKIYLDREYFADEVVTFAYKINMGNMYEYDPEKGYADYTFTPGWFDEIAVDNLTIRWNDDKVERFIPSCVVDNGYNTWNTSLRPGEKYTVTVTYPGEAYPFVVFEKSEDDDGYNFSEHNLIENILFSILIGIFMVFMVAVFAAPVVIPILIIVAIYKAATGFTTGSEKKITRTVIEYYPSCPNCGGTREENKDTCQYCGSSMIKSKQEIKEEEARKNHQDILKYRENGTFRYSDNPNRYVRVNVISIPRPVTRTSSSSHHSSCAHSSCACACACACAGGGRAGCSMKDFYNTDLKFRYFRL